MTKMKDEQARLITAMALWEAILEVKDEDAEIKATFENIGTNGVRYYAALWCEKLDAAWNALSDEEKEANVPFDWEFVPRWLKENIDWQDLHQPMFVGGRA